MWHGCVAGTFKAGGRPLEGLEVTDGMSFERGEQTPFIIGGSLATDNPSAAALAGPQEARAFAWAGYVREI